MKGITTIILSAVLIYSCGNAQEDQVTESESTLLQLSEEQIAFNKIRTGPVPRGEFVRTIKVTGRMDIPPNYSIDLSVPVTGYITKVMILPGNHVKKGQVLVEMRHPEIARVQEEFIMLKQQVDFLRKDVERKSSLVEGNAVSTREFDQMKSELSAKEARLQGLLSEVERLGIKVDNISAESISQIIEVRAPIAGVVTDLFAAKGSLINPERTLLTIMNNDHEHIELEVFQQDIIKVRRGMKVDLKIPGDSNIFTGEIYLVNTKLDRNNLAAKVHVHPEEKFPSIPVNSLVFAEIIYEQDSAFQLPVQEILKEGEMSSVFIKTGDGYKKQLLSTGRKNDRFVEILGPPEVFKNEIVLSGNYNLNGM